MRRLRKLGLAAILLLGLGIMASVGSMLTGVSPPVVTAIIPAEFGVFTVPATVGLMVSSLGVTAMIAARLINTETINSRLRVAFAMSAFTRHVTEQGLEAARWGPVTRMIDLVSEIPKRIAAAAKGTGFGDWSPKTRLRHAVSLN